jgi:hypothetical protein
MSLRQGHWADRPAPIAGPRAKPGQDQPQKVIVGCAVTQPALPADSAWRVVVCRPRARRRADRPCYGVSMAGGCRPDGPVVLTRRTMASMPPAVVKVHSATRRSICRTWPGAHSRLLLDPQGPVVARRGIRGAAAVRDPAQVRHPGPSSRRAAALGERLRLRRDR